MDKTDIASSVSVAQASRLDNIVAPTITPRGPLSSLLLLYTGANRSTADISSNALRTAARLCLQGEPDVMTDDDIQLSMFYLYSLAYGSFQQWGAQWEWNPLLIEVRAMLEGALEDHLREHAEVPPVPCPLAADVASTLFDLTAPGPGPSLSRYVATKATMDQLKEAIILKTIYTLREADPHSWAIPRVTGHAKAALVEIQADEYGNGDFDRVHAHMFAHTARRLGLDTTYGAYIDSVPAVLLATHNVMSLFGLNRRLRGSIIGHLAAYEMTSTLPCRNYSNGMRRLGLGADVTAYFDEHVEADAIHEQIAGHDLAGSLAEDEPGLVGDILLGAAAHLYAEGLVERHVLEAWGRGATSLRAPARLGQVA